MIGPRLIRIEPRDVPLGGVRAMNVTRTLPHRRLPMVGAWCFLDRFGPDTVRMRVEPHPHIGLQTVTWPLVGEVRHRDSIGSDVTLTRGALNLMTAGTGIAHSEYSVGEDAVALDALQLWVALPDEARRVPPGFEQHTALPQLALTAASGSAASATVVLGEFAGIRSPATVYSPLIGAEIALPAGSAVPVPLRPEWEHAVVLVHGDALLDGTALGRDELVYLGDERDSVTLSTTEGALVFLLGGAPFEDNLVMWWNFAAASHDDIVRARDDWEAHADRFGLVAGHGDERIPAPPLPPVRLRPRHRSL